ncbi:MAG TPA: acyl-CoA dehydrogenase family protein [Candidatus Thermoplasmatota archaeon]|jgi:alkylation response protein AidB-like acyl-CoA dehydrogenase|nr:acyl-CoA dehydrogenase family protein [Candidatus Thermoplasmatota archaeon]
MEPQVNQELLGAARKIAPTLREHAAEGERQRRVPKASWDALRSAGLLRLYLPKGLGGLEADPVTVARVVEEVALADTAAAWMLQANVNAWWCARMPEEGVRAMWGKDPDTVGGAAFFPPVPAVEVPGGVKLTGRRPFASGAHDSPWMMLTGMIMDNGQPRMVQGHPAIVAAFFPTSQATIHDTWHTLGLRGTDTEDVEVKDLVVPSHLTFPMAPEFTPNKLYAGSLYRAPAMAAHIGAIMAPIALALARNALTEVVALAQTKQPFPATSMLRDRPVAQGRIAEAEATLRAARALLYGTLQESWDRTRAGKEHTLAQKNEVMLAAVHAMKTCSDAMQSLHTIAGTSGIYTRNALERHFRDLMTLRQHGLINASRYETAGQVLLGLPPDMPFVAF